jgi:tetratricopeptide (TPR) repeat protein
LKAGRPDPDDVGELARLALREGEEERALPIVSRAARQLRNARLWQWTGLLQRALDEHEAALSSFEAAARLAPADPGIAQGRAHVALEGGLDAVALFERARRLAPAKGDVLIGHAAARVAAGRAEEAVADLDAILAQVPLWLDGHAQLAQIRATQGRGGEASQSLERALRVLPGEPALWRALLELHLRRSDYQALAGTVRRARAAGVPEELAWTYDVIAAAELGETGRADQLFKAAAPGALAIWRIRHLLRTGRVGEALPIIETELASDRAAAAWPYAAAAWRLARDRRSAWLEGDPRLVSVIDLGSDLPDLTRLGEHLRSLHVAKGEYLDQSVRGGTQTDGPLLSRIEPEIRQLRTAIVGAVRRYLTQVPAEDRSHPLLRYRRDRRIRFAGSWSVRLRGAGHHANHVHPQGWISSALYVSLPQRQAGEDPHAGWLTLGAPQAELGLDLPPIRRIEPKEGQLVLFPSWMWHGTVPFAAGERLTVAFDVAPPR